MFRRKGQDRSNRLARVRGTKGTISEENPKSNLLSLWAPPRASAVPPDTGLRVGSSEDRGVGRGDTETGPDRGFLEKRGRKGVGGPNGSMSTKSYRWDRIWDTKSSEVTSASMRFLRRFSRITRAARPDRSLKATRSIRVSNRIRMPHAPQAARPSRAERSRRGHLARTTADKSRFTRIVGL